MDEIYLEVILNVLDVEGERKESKVRIDSDQFTYFEIVNNPQLTFPLVTVSFNVGNTEDKILNFKDAELVVATVYMNHQDISKSYDCFVYSYIGIEKGNIDTEDHLYDINAKMVCLDPTLIELFQESENKNGVYKDTSLSLLKKIMGGYSMNFQKGLYTDDFMAWKRVNQNDMQFINYIKDRMDIDKPYIVLRNKLVSNYTINEVLVADFDKLLELDRITDDNTINLNYSNVTVYNSIKNYNGNSKSEKNSVTYNKEVIGFNDRNTINVSDSDRLNIESDETYAGYLNHLNSNNENLKDVMKQSGDIIINDIDLLEYSKLEIGNYINIDDDLYIINQLYMKYVQRTPKPLITVKVFKIK